MAGLPGRTRASSRRVTCRGSAAAVVIATALSATGCSDPGLSDAGAPTPAGTPAISPHSSASSTPPAPVLLPDGTASDNLPLFTAVTESVWESSKRDSGRAYVDALTAAGFDKAAMQVTADMSTVGNPAESIQFSVLWGDECLVGQVGPATGEAVTIVVPELPEGGCLVGRTRAIDW